MSIRQPQFLSEKFNQPYPVESNPQRIFKKAQQEIFGNLVGENLPQTVLKSPKEEIRIKNLVETSKNSQLPPPKAPPSLAPFSAHPVLHFIKNRNTIDPNKLITFRSNDINKLPREDITTLILKPVARSIAGVDGKAIATPLSKAILRQGTNVDILFEPEAVAIAGPGGIAHAESDLEITYEDTV